MSLISCMCVEGLKSSIRLSSCEKLLLFLSHRDKLENSVSGGRRKDKTARCTRYQCLYCLKIKDLCWDNFHFFSITDLSIRRECNFILWSFLLWRHEARMHMRNCRTHFTYYEKYCSSCVQLCNVFCGFSVFIVTVNKQPCGDLHSSLSKYSNNLMSSPVEAYLRRAAWWGQRSGPSWWCGKHDRGCWSDGMCRSRGLSSRPQGEREPAEPATHPLGLRKRNQRRKLSLHFLTNKLVRMDALCVTQQLNSIS